MGRPKKKPMDRLSCPVATRLRTKDYDRLTKDAKLAGLDLTDFVRQIILERKSYERTVSTDLKNAAEAGSPEQK
jgi:hypothetical protein